MSAGTGEKSSRKHKASRSEPPEATDDAENPEGSTLKKKSKKSRRVPSAPEPGSAAGGSAVEEGLQLVDTPEHKPKKRRRRERDETEAEEPKKSKRQKRDKHVDKTTFAEEDVEGASSNLDGGGVSQGEETTVDRGESADGKRPKKTSDRKKKKDMSEDSERQPKKRKKTKGRASSSEFPDPSADESLGEQANKALRYAYSHVVEPAGWKFNKARQNWLIRNIWSAEAMPETYVPLVTRYMRGIQGGARENLVKTCREKLSPTNLSAAPAEPTQATAEATATGKVRFAETDTVAGPAMNDEVATERANLLLSVLAPDAL